jgi:hypothetical protein
MCCNWVLRQIRALHLLVLQMLVTKAKLTRIASLMGQHWVIQLVLRVKIRRKWSNNCFSSSRWGVQDWLRGKYLWLMNGLNHSHLNKGKYVSQLLTREWHGQFKKWPKKYARMAMASSSLSKKVVLPYLGCRYLAMLANKICLKNLSLIKTILPNYCNRASKIKH